MSLGGVINRAYTVYMGFKCPMEIQSNEPSFSGGNKRRLSLGIALVGLPEVLLLDEPTTGVDPKARRVIWDILSKIREFGSSLILTSHSMEECEALCTNLAIMVNGQFKCLGSPQHIKTKYGAGYTLLVRLEAPQWAKQVKSEIAKIFPGAALKVMGGFFGIGM